MHIVRSTRFWILAAVIVALTFLHQANVAATWRFHQVLDIVPYFLIILGALWFGLAGGITCALLTSTCYLIHLGLHEGGDFFGANIHRTLNILMFNVVGITTGYLTRKQHQTLRRYQETAEQLERSYAALKEKTTALLESEKQLARASRLSALGELAAGLAHEIGTPLGSLKGAAEIVAEGIDPEDRRARFASLLLAEVERLDGVVRTFLDYARPGDGEEGAPCTEVGPILEEIAALAGPECERDGIELSIDLPADLPPVSCDSGAFRQIIFNLVVNARQATAPGGRIRISVRRAGSEVGVAIEDTGAGIPRELRERIFDPFFSTKRRGIGLGLAITQRIVTGAGGRIEVASELGRGSTFTVWLPVDKHEPAIQIGSHRR